MRRRTFLAVMGAGTLTGCNALGGNSTFESKKPGDAFSNVGTPSGLGKGDTGTSARVTLGKGQYTNLGFELGERSKMVVTGQVTKNAPIDMYVMTASQFNDFKRKPNLVPSETAAEGVTSIDVTNRFSSGNYFLVFDNTPLGQTEPSGEAVADFEFVLTGTGNG
ncbi:hypothetical protein ACFR9U_12650 [Halorientalis brevis]|uniref:Lipoprotein n=1 Tax=Halorientalis brevis TaxID=1126241 RepID=A0ABD6CDB7_9EURY|nr:hypothetical protein [Halorientalis brevis]